MFTLPLPLDDFLDVRDALIDEALPRRSTHASAEDIPSHRLGRHFVPDVSWVVDQFKDGVRSVIPLTVAVFVDPSVTSRSLGVTLREFSKDFWDERGLENESVCFPVRW